MRVSSGNHPSISRRRGTTRGRTRGSPTEMILNQKSILVLAALCATIFSMGLILGTRIFGSPQPNAVAGNNGGGSSSSGKGVAESSPLAAATSNMTPDIQKLIMESAKAEAIEKKEHELEVDALKHGDTKLAAHLRGALVPGDANYNPHHHVDDATDQVDDVVAAEEGEGGGDGGMYAGDHGDHGKNAEDQGDSMHNHFMEALKNEEHELVEKVKKGKEHLVESMHDQFAKALESEKKVVEEVKGVAKKAIGGLRGATHKDEDSGGVQAEMESQVEESKYPYMTSLVSKDFDFQSYNPPGGGLYAEYKTGGTPYVITQHLMEQSDELARSRRYHVKGAMQHIWKSYQEKAYGKDELHPISGQATSNWGGMGTTLVDSLSTLWLMGMKDEFWEARDWVRDHLSHSGVGQVSGFETTIRSLGGLLSAYDLSKDKAFLTKADELGSRLIKAYDTPSGLPHGSINLQNGRHNNFSWNANAYILAEVGTQQIEYRYLSRATGKEDYAKKSERVFDILNKMQPADGLLSQNIKDGGGHPSFSGNKISFGAMGDSTYEYMIKIWVQGGRKEPLYRDMWDKAMDGLHNQLVQTSSPNGLTFIADRVNGKIDRKMDHLVCFMGGALALGAYTDPKGLDSKRAQRDLKTAKALTYTCYQMYAKTKTGIAPEYVRFSGNDDMRVPPDAPFYILRPETVEAFFYLSKLTGDPIYREWGWQVFESIEKYCKTKYGYGSLKHVEKTNSVEDRMESFFMAETLKYLYLLFDPDTEIDILNKHVFNTEAHPLTIFQG